MISRLAALAALTSMHLLALLAGAAPQPAAAQVHRWVDERGVVQYGDRPPAAGATTLRVPAGPQSAYVRTSPAAAATPAAANPDKPRTAAAGTASRPTAPAPNSKPSAAERMPAERLTTQHQPPQPPARPAQLTRHAAADRALRGQPRRRLRYAAGHAPAAAREHAHNEGRAGAHRRHPGAPRGEVASPNRPRHRRPRRRCIGRHHGRYLDRDCG